MLAFQHLPDTEFASGPSSAGKGDPGGPCLCIFSEVGRAVAWPGRLRFPSVFPAPVDVAETWVVHG